MEKRLRQLNKLKVMLTTSQNFKEVFNFFFDHFGENPDFLDEGEPIIHDALQRILILTAERALGLQNLQMDKNVFIRVKDLQFIHGIGMLNEYMMNMFYFEDIDTGMCALANPLEMGETKIARFSCYNPKKIFEPSSN